MCGAQALAVSLCVMTVGGEDREDYGPAARLAVRVAEWMRAHPLPRGAMYNLNVPALPYAQIRGLVPARLAPVFLEDASYEPVPDGQGARYRYRKGAGLPLDDPDCDLAKIDAGFATLTKLTWDFRLNGDDAELGGIGL